jgi:hypothetical protein
MSGAVQQNNLESGAIFKLYTAAGISADVDLTIDWPGYNGRRKLLPRWICYTGGVVIVTDAQGNSTTLPADFAGIPLPLDAAGITNTGTDATQILVIW